MSIVCQQTILMKYHALFVIFEKAAKFEISSAANYRWHFRQFAGNAKPNHPAAVCILLTPKTPP